VYTGTTTLTKGFSEKLNRDLNFMSAQQANTVKIGMYVLSVVVTLVGALALILYNNVLSDISALKVENANQNREIAAVREVVVEMREQNKNLKELVIELRENNLKRR